MIRSLQSSSWRSLAVWLALFGAPLVLGDWTLDQLAQFITYGIFALALGFMWGQVGVLSFGQAVFFGVGAYAMALTNLGMIPFLGTGTATGFALAVACSAVLAALLGSLLFYGRGLAGAYFGIVTLCVAVIAESIVRRSDFIGGSNGLNGVLPFDIPAAVSRWVPGDSVNYYIALAAALLVFALLQLLARSPFGTVLAAIRDNERRAAFLGYDVAMQKNTAFVLSAAISALSGAMFVKLFGFVSPTLVGFALSTEVLIWVAVGGRQALLAAFLGAILVRSIESALSERFGDYWLVLLGAVFVMVVVFFPAGVFGNALRPAPQRRFRGKSSETPAGVRPAKAPT